MRTALVTGSSGVLGSILALELSRKGYRVIGVDLSTFTKTDNGLSGFVKKDIKDLELDDLRTVDVIYHCASFAETHKHFANPLQIIDTCYAGTKRVLELAKQMNSKVIFISTVDVNNPFDVSSARHPYVAGKIAAESLCAGYASSGLDVKIIRLNNLYGTIGENDKRVIPTFIRNANNGVENVITENAIKGFCYIQDALDMLLDLDKTKSTTFLYQLEAPQISISNLSLLVKKVVFAKTSIEAGLEKMI